MGLAAGVQNDEPAQQAGLHRLCAPRIPGNAVERFPFADLPKLTHYRALGRVVAELGRRILRRHVRRRISTPQANLR